jgi:hypothetical protein
VRVERGSATLMQGGVELAWDEWTVQKLSLCLHAGSKLHGALIDTEARSGTIDALFMWTLSRPSWIELSLALGLPGELLYAPRPLALNKPRQFRLVRSTVSPHCVDGEEALSI